ncbi:hypothetical protein QVD17_37098 [Tagetes erecta]|uniref:Cysteine-rich receptor-like protein kinase 2 n=1 Tax=Tagetes erecta TaxID=13708 RepID=A0AAD8JXK4_TARER|nr:hypothetical protein QVD17_37098 [Tagetes erecta]
MAVMVVFLLLLLTKQGFSQLNDSVNNSTNVLINIYCSRDAVISLTNFIQILKSTFNQLRTELLSKRVLFARAQALSAGDSVYAAAQCRNYLSVDQCVACFDISASKLVNCNSGSAYISFNNCSLRYEGANFYTNPYVNEDGNGTPYSVISCGNQSASQPTAFKQAVDEFLSDVRDATPKTPNFYVASTRNITSENATVYVTSECVESVNLTICQNCMKKAYEKLNGCFPNTEGRFFDVACFVRYSDTPFFNVNQTTDITNILKGLGQGEGSSSRVSIIVAATGGAVIIALIILSWFLYQSRKKSKGTEQDFEGTVHYNYNDLQLATNNFSEENILGKGGFGEVFKAFLEDNIVAVKKLQVQHAGVKKEFESEVKLISNIQHRNLLRLLGWSTEGSYLLLVLEYMPNGSLDRFLWDFGLARFQPEDQTHVSTKFAGTLGYTAPEYALHGHLSEKVDTYSFGIVILEVISGKRSTEVKSGSQSSDYLLENTWKLYEKKRHIKVIDETLKLNLYEEEHVKKVIEIALLCTQSPASVRPTMTEVVVMLQEGRSLGKRQLTRPTFVNNQDRRIYKGSSRTKTQGQPTTTIINTDNKLTMKKET